MGSDLSVTTKETSRIMPTYVRQSAKLTCSMGSAQSAMQLSHPVNPVLICGAPMAGMADNRTFMNIAPFGLCKSLINPTVIAATAAAGGKLQEMPCVPNMLISWLNPKRDVFVKGRPALTDGSRCVCMWAGIIEVKSAGQNSVISVASPPPAAVAERQTQAAVAEAKEKAEEAAKNESAAKGLKNIIAAAVKKVMEKVVDAIKERVKSALYTISTAVGTPIVAALSTWIRGVAGKADEVKADVNVAKNEAAENATTAEKCFCNRDIGVDEFEEIVKGLRSADGRKDLSLFTVKCNIPLEDRTIKRLTEEFNKACVEYGINHCIQKIHFLSQIYLESDHFNTTLEYATGTKYNPERHADAKKMGNTKDGDGPKYKGRGLMQLTWRNHQLAYLKHARDKFETLRGLTDADIENRDNCFEKLISDTLFGSVDSAGWYWGVWKQIPFKIDDIYNKTLNYAALFADKYQEHISKTINGGESAITQRKIYYEELKKIMNIYQCPNILMADIGTVPPKKEKVDKEKQQNSATAKDNQSSNLAKADGGQTSQKTGGADKITQNSIPTSNTAITARLTRFHFGRMVTLGRFEMFHKDKKDSIFDGYVCEDVVRGKGKSSLDAVKKWKIAAESAIPYGTYICALTPSTKYGIKWEVTKVPGYTGVRIHTGNYAKDTEGCLLLGISIDEKYSQVNESGKKVKAFEKLMSEYGNQDFTLEITDDRKSGVTNDEFTAELSNAPSVSSTVSRKCFCNGEFTTDDLKRIIKALRKAEPNVSGGLFCADDCDIPRDEKTIERLTAEINATCKKRGIDTCIQKIHFLSQIYHESDRFRTSLGNEGLDNDPKYKDRGLIRLIGRETQLTYLKSVKNQNEVLKNIISAIKDKMTTGSIWATNNDILKDLVGKNKKDLTDAVVNPKVDAIIDRQSNNYETIISDSLATCVDSAGWYWNEWKRIPFDIKDIKGKTLNEAALFADKYQEIITRTINDTDEAKIKTKIYYDTLKNVLNVYQCPNVSKADCAVATQHTVGTDKDKVTQKPAKAKDKQSAKRN